MNLRGRNRIDRQQEAMMTRPFDGVVFRLKTIEKPNDNTFDKAMTLNEADEILAKFGFAETAEVLA